MLALRITLVAALFALVAAAGLPGRALSLSNRIVGGESADIKDVPCSNRYCGASIISDKFTLTVAHCVDENAMGPLTGFISAGSSRLGQGERYYIHSQIIHEKFNIDDYDIAVLEVERAFQFGPTIQPIALHEANENVPDNTEVIASGWGKLAFQGADPDVLQKVKAILQSEDTCTDAWYGYGGGVTDRMLCATAEGKEVCDGDDGGGPLVANGKQIGVASFGMGCGFSGFPGVYARISHPELRKFIKNNANV